MGSLSANSESGVSPVSPNSISPVADSQTPNFKISNLDSETLDLTFSKIASNRDRDLGYEFNQKEGGYSFSKNGSLQRSDKKTHTKKKKQVFLEGYDDDDLTRTKSLTDEDLNELKGCVDLGFGFSYNEIPELCNTLPALELCYSLSQKFLDDASEGGGSSPSVFVSSWKFSSPGDQPEEVKARLKFWAQAVACTVKLCSC